MPPILWQPDRSLSRDNAVGTATRLQADYTWSDLGNTLFCLLRSVTLVLEVAIPCSVGTGGEAIRQRLELELSE